ncbi:MAG: PKD domain-containing protein, partial [Candidatus Hodarchaeota archaeon]
WVELVFTFENGSNYKLNHHFSNNPGANNSFRIPVSPIDRGFPIDLVFQVFDPGNDDITVQVDFGSTEKNTTFTKQDLGLTNGIISISGAIDDLSDVKYSALDEDGESSRDYYLPLADYALDNWNDSFSNIPTWQRWGFVISHYAADAVWLASRESAVNSGISFFLLPIHYNISKLKYDWHFGDGYRSPEPVPIHTYANAGNYLVWAIISDGYYESVVYQWVNITNSAPSAQMNIQGFRTNGRTLTFEAIAVNDENVDSLLFYWDFGDSISGIGRKTDHIFTNSGNYNVTLNVVDDHGVITQYSEMVNITNIPPELQIPLDNIKISEGQTITFNVNVSDSPYDLLRLNYNWKINDKIFTEPAGHILLKNGLYSALLNITDPEGSILATDFNITIDETKLEITVPKYNVYGFTNETIRIYGTISPSVFNQLNITEEIEINYSLMNKNGIEITKGQGEFFEKDYKFSMDVNISEIGDKQEIESLYNILTSMEDLYSKRNILPSGEYTLKISALDNDTKQVISSSQTSISITLDQDGDFITDELEVVYQLEGNNLELSPWSTDSDDDGKVDPVEVVLGQDIDNDGLTTGQELDMGLDPFNPDTDGDKLLDGFASNGFGEAQYGTDPLKNDTDDDGLLDYTEVAGWDIIVSTEDGKTKIYRITSDPTLNDTDNDGLRDTQEYFLKSDPRIIDTDYDKLTDLKENNLGTSPSEYDSDQDGLNDYIESEKPFSVSWVNESGISQSKTFYCDPISNDTDEDGLTDYNEVYQYNTDASNRDTDNDGVIDSEEIHKYGTNVKDADTDDDGLLDGFEIEGIYIPIAIITNGEYDEEGKVLVEPEVANITKLVKSDPLHADSDGDGLSDYDELMSQVTVSNPMSPDSDGDGIPDRDDPERLVTDSAPPVITTNIDLKYEVSPQNVKKAITKVFMTGIQKLVDLVKTWGNFFKNIWNRCWYKSCWDWWFFGWHTSCIWKLHSLKTIAKIVVEELLYAARKSVEILLPGVKEYSTASKPWFEGFGVGIKWLGPIPVGLNIWGAMKVTATKFVDEITSIVNPTVDVSFTAEDDAGIKKIMVWKDNKYHKTIDTYGLTVYRFNERFSLTPQGFSLPQTTLKIKIYDMLGNARVIERTTSKKQFTLSLLKAGVFVLTDSLGIPQDVVQWVMNKIGEFIQKAKEVVKQVIEFIKNIPELLLNFTISALEFVWEAFLQGYLSLMRNSYVQEARSSLQIILDMYNNGTVKQFINNSIDHIATSSEFQTMNKTIGEMEVTFDQYVPTVDVNMVQELLQKFLGPFEFFKKIGTIVLNAIKYLGMKALEIIKNVIKRLIDRLMLSKLKPLIVFIMEQIDNFKNFYDKINADLGFLPKFDPSIDNFDFSNVKSSLFDILGVITNPFTLIRKTLALFTKDNMIGFIDLFLKDTSEKYTMADLLLDVLSPAVAAMFAIKDGITYIGDLFSLITSNIGDIVSLERVQSNRGILVDKETTIKRLETTISVIGIIDGVFSSIIMRTISFGSYLALKKYTDDNKVADIVAAITDVVGGIFGVTTCILNFIVWSEKGELNTSVKEYEANIYCTVVNDVLISMVTLLLSVAACFTEVDIALDILWTVADLLGKMFASIIESSYGWEDDQGNPLTGLEHAV